MRRRTRSRPGLGLAYLLECNLPFWADDLINKIADGDTHDYVSRDGDAVNVVSALVK